MIVSVFSISLDNATAFKWSDRYDEQLFRKADPTYLKSYEDYYTACSDCIRRNGQTFIPRLPDGLVPQAGQTKYERRDGLPAPSAVRPDQVVPGSVWLLSTQIVINSQLPSPGEAPNCPIAFPDRTKRAAINASGLYGGRGGAGSPSICVSITPGSSFRCSDELFQRTGVSGPSGTGGDGGFVFIGTIGSQAQANLPEIRASIDVSGGPAPNSDGYLSPNTSWGDWGKKSTGSICDFFQRKVKPRPGASEGKPGAIETRAMSPENAFVYFMDLVRLHDATGGYDYPEIKPDQLASKFSDELPIWGQG